MNRRITSFIRGVRTTGLLIRAAAASLVNNWALGLFSLAAAFAIWFVVEEVDNPRTEGLVPAEADQRIRVEALNIPDGLIVLQMEPVRARVRARTDLIPRLRAADFRATVNLQGITEPGIVTLPVEVVSLRNDVRVLAVEPASIRVQVVRAAVEDIPITLLPSGSLPEGYRLADNPTVDPAFVRITGPQELVDSVDSVGVTINLNGLRDSTVEVDGQLVARTASGNPVSVTLSPERVRVTLHIEQTISRRVLPVEPRITGSPAPGFMVTSISVDPQLVAVTGPKAVVDNLTSLTLAPSDVSNVSIRQVSTPRIVPIPNVTLEKETVQVTIDIQPLTCGGENGSCGNTIISVAPVFENLPASLALTTPARYTALVTVSAPPAVMQSLRLNEFRATVNLSSAVPGPNHVVPTVTGPAGVTIESVEPITVNLTAVELP